MDSKVFKQMLSPFGLLIGGSIAIFFLLVEKQLERMEILYLSGHQKVILFFWYNFVGMVYVDSEKYLRL